MTNTTELTSLKNDLIKFAIKLQDSKFRKENKLIFADGDKTIEGFINDNIEFEYLFLKKDNLLYKKAKTKNIVYVNDDILKKLSSTKSPCSMAGIIKEPEINPNDFIKLNKIILIENIKDAGNLGTIIRSATAFSIEGIILLGDCVDLYNTKVIRSATQNIFKLPILRTTDINFIEKLKKNHKLISTVVKDGVDFNKQNYSKPFILAFGSEAEGLSDKFLNISDIKTTLFMDNNVESLNLGVCVSIACYKIKELT